MPGVQPLVNREVGRVLSRFFVALPQSRARLPNARNPTIAPFLSTNQGNGPNTIRPTAVLALLVCCGCGYQLSGAGRSTSGGPIPVHLTVPPSRVELAVRRAVEDAVRKALPRYGFVVSQNKGKAALLELRVLSFAAVGVAIDADRLAATQDLELQIELNIRRGYSSWRSGLLTVREPAPLGYQALANEQVRHSVLSILSARAVDRGLARLEFWCAHASAAQRLRLLRQ